MRNKVISVVKSGLSALFGLFIICDAYAALPAGYTELEYLQSSGAGQYIDTGFYPNQNTSVEVTYMNTDENGNTTIVLGTTTVASAGDAYNGLVFLLSPNRVGFGNGPGTTASLSGTVGNAANTKYTLRFDKRVVSWNDGNTVTIPPSATWSAPNSLYLFGRNTAGTLNYPMIGRIYSYKAWNNGTLVQNFVPVKYVSGGTTTYGMYDLMDDNPSTAFHTNRGEGAFTGGNPVPTYTELEYIESDGTQYADIHFVPNARTRVDWKGQLTSAESSVPLMGCRVGGSNPGRFFPLAKSTGPTARTTYGSIDATNVPFDANTVYTGSFRPAEGKSIINGVTYSLSGATFEVTENNSFYLFATSGYPGNLYNSQGKIWYVKIWDDGTLVHDLVPARRDSDGRIGMFDTISRQFFDNAASSSVNFSGGTVCPAGQNQITYTSATGTVTQNGTPTPANPIYPTFYTQGQMVLRKVGDIADSYDASTGKITRRVGVKVLNGTEPWVSAGSGEVGRVLVAVHKSYFPWFSASYTNYKCSHLKVAGSDNFNTLSITSSDYGFRLGLNTTIIPAGSDKVATVRTWLAQQYANGTPVTVYYPLATPVEEDWAVTQCVAPIKIATTKYNNTAFGPVVTALNNAVDTIKTVVANTITQATAVANLQSDKQRRPNPTDTNGTCPNYRQCLLVEDNQGNPYWYEIMDPFYNLFKPVITNQISASSVTSAESYTQLEYIRSDGTAYIDTGYTPTANTKIEVVAKMDAGAGNVNIVGSGCSANNGASTYSILTINSYDDTHPEIKFGPSYNWNSNLTAAMTTKQTLAISRTQFTVDGDVLATNTTAITCSSGTPEPFYLFQRWRPTITTANDKVQIYGFRIYENNVLQMNLVPARFGGVVGMYNTVNGDFLTTPQGTLTAGSAVANTEVPTTPLWRANFAANSTYNILASTVYGSAKCNATSGTANTAATSTQMSNANWTASGNYCWCHIDSVTDSSNNSGISTVNNWVWVSVTSGTCATSCANKCATTMQTGTNTAFRKAITGIQ